MRVKPTFHTIDLDTIADLDRPFNHDDQAGEKLLITFCRPKPTPMPPRRRNKVQIRRPASAQQPAAGTRCNLAWETYGLRCRQGIIRHWFVEQWPDAMKIAT